jgi:uncharacterized protein (TIGR02246 family)
MRKLLPLTLMFIAVLPALAKDDETKIKAVVEDRYKEWIAAASKKDAEALTDLYDENAVLMPKQEEPVIGKAAIGEHYQKLVADPHYVPFTETFESNSFHVVGDIAIDTADFDGELTSDGKQIHFHGKILIVWKKQKDGSWKIFRYMFDEIPAKKLQPRTEAGASR